MIKLKNGDKYRIGKLQLLIKPKEAEKIWVTYSINDEMLVGLEFAEWELKRFLYLTGAKKI